MSVADVQLRPSTVAHHIAQERDRDGFIHGKPVERFSVFVRRMSIAKGGGLALWIMQFMLYLGDCGANKKFGVISCRGWKK